MGSSKQGIRLTPDNQDVCIFQEPIVIIRLNAWSTSHHELILGKSLCHLDHCREIILDFLTAATSQQGNNLPGGIHGQL